MYGRDVGVNCASPPQEGTGDAALGGRLCRLVISSLIWLWVFALYCKITIADVLPEDLIHAYLKIVYKYMWDYVLDCVLLETLGLVISSGPIVGFV